MAWNLEEATNYYKQQGAPRDQTALIALLREIQTESGGSIPSYMLQAVCDSYEVKESFLLAVIKRIPSLKLANYHYLELCAGRNCGKHAKLAAYAEALQKDTGSFTLKFVSCMRMCGKGPNIKWDGTLYHRADEALLQKLIESGNK